MHDVPKILERHPEFRLIQQDRQLQETWIEIARWSLYTTPQVWHRVLITRQNDPVVEFINVACPLNRAEFTWFENSLIGEQIVAFVEDLIRSRGESVTPHCSIYWDYLTDKETRQEIRVQSGETKKTPGEPVSIKEERVRAVLLNALKENLAIRNGFHPQYVLMAAEAKMELIARLAKDLGIDPGSL